MMAKQKSAQEVMNISFLLARHFARFLGKSRVSGLFSERMKYRTKSAKC